MDDDNKPIDASIRPVLPSRQGAPAPEPMWSDPVVPVSSKPMRNIAIGRKKSRGPIIGEKPVKKPKDKKRSTIAKAAWQTRRKNAGKSPLLAAPYGVEGEHFAAAISAMMKLKPAQRTLVMQILQSLAP